MDKLGKRLQEDAAALDVTVSDELQKRVQASWQATERPVPRRAPARSRAYGRAAAFAGVAAAAALAAILFRPAGGPVGIATPPVQVADNAVPLPTALRAVNLTDPLDEEMENLQADLQKVRSRIEHDIGFRL